MEYEDVLDDPLIADNLDESHLETGSNYGPDE